MIALLTDFGTAGPYVGELLAVLARQAPGVTVVNLMSDLPRWRPRSAAYLVAALVARQPVGTVFVTVVDPGVGMRSRRPVWLEADGRILVGPDNGLLDVAARMAERARLREIQWRPPRMSATFHGRDLFAPVAARLALGESVPSTLLRRRFAWSSRWPQDLDEVIYVDGYGNCMTGRRAGTLTRRAVVRTADGVVVRHARTFGAVAPGEALWFENSLGLVEVACNRRSASEALGMGAGSPITVG